MCRLFGIVLSILFVLSETAVAAPAYITAPAMETAINTPVGAVQPGQINVPVITWGADMRTIYAAGNSRTTTSGSLFDQAGLNVKLYREDVFTNQIADYLSGKTPYLRGTLGMINMAERTLAKDARTQPVVIYQLSESAGGDALVVKSGIKSAKDLRGKTVALQAYGPHVDYLATVLTDAGLSFKDVTIKWVPDLTGTDNTPMAAFYEKNVDAAMMITPDALALTSGGTVGTGSEQSVRGATVMLSTKTANRVIADVYAVRSDYFKAQHADVQKFVHTLMKAQEEVGALTANKISRARDYQLFLKASAEILLDSAQAGSDAEALFGDAEHMDYAANVRFFTDRNYPRNFERRTKSIQKSLGVLGLTSGNSVLASANWDFSSFKTGLNKTAVAEAPKFDASKVASVVAKKQQQGTLEQGELFSFEVFFEPNQQNFSPELYQEAFDRVSNLAATYGGALITVEGHSDPLGYLRQRKDGANEMVLRRVAQSAKNLSLTRAAAVRDAVIANATRKSIPMDPSQFAVVGHGIAMPRSGMCGTDPCAPKTEKEWRDNMRVVFRIIQVEAEAEVFRPL